MTGNESTDTGYFIATGVLTAGTACIAGAPPKTSPTLQPVFFWRLPSRRAVCYHDNGHGMYDNNRPRRSMPAARRCGRALLSIIFETDTTLFTTKPAYQYNCIRTPSSQCGSRPEGNIITCL
ncbi:hypothetical protein MRX96_041197 [Rhipicephalus microplus]